MNAEAPPSFTSLTSSTSLTSLLLALSPFPAQISQTPSRNSFPRNDFQKTPRGWGIPPTSGLPRPASRQALSLSVKSFALIFFRTLLHLAKTYPFLFQQLPHSLHKTPGVGGTCVVVQTGRVPGSGRSRQTSLLRLRWNTPVSRALRNMPCETVIGCRP
jgi:hypothetical protein